MRLLSSLLATTIALTPITGQSLPKDGAGVLRKMHDAYQGKWYNTLIFSQTTTMAQRDGTNKIETWYESLWQSPTRGTVLRIDQGDLAAGKFSVSTADSTITANNNVLVRSRAGGNPFLPLIEGVYMQPVERTAREVSGLNVDMTKVAEGMWQGQKVWIVGATSAADTMSSQFWVETKKLVVVRFLLGQPAGRAPMDVQLDKYEKVGNGWLATKVTMFVNGKAQQTEEYHDWKVGVPLTADLFDPTTWATAKHWAKGN